MGYRSYFSLSVHELGNGRIKKDADPQIIARLRQVNENAEYAICDDGSTNEGAKWYDCGEDLGAFSSGYPGILFEMSREGEDPGDLEKIFAYEGKWYSEYAEIVWPVFDKDNLGE